MKRLAFVVTLLNQLQTDPLYSNTTLGPRPPQQAIQESLHYLNSLVQASQVAEPLVANSLQSSTQQKLSPTHLGKRQPVSLTKPHLCTKSTLPTTHESQSKVTFATHSLASTVTPVHYRTGTIMLQQMMAIEEHQVLHFYVKKLIEKVNCRWKEESSALIMGEPKHQVSCQQCSCLSLCIESLYTIVPCYVCYWATVYQCTPLPVISFSIKPFLMWCWPPAKHTCLMHSGFAEILKVLCAVHSSDKQLCKMSLTPSDSFLAILVL